MKILLVNAPHQSIGSRLAKEQYQFFFVTKLSKDKRKLRDFWKYRRLFIKSENTNLKNIHHGQQIKREAVVA